MPFDPKLATLPGDAPMSGLSHAEVARRRATFGPNAMPDAASSAWRMVIGKFWAPVPWMLELGVIFQLALGAYGEATVIAVLLLFNGLLGFSRPGMRKPRWMR